jgi:FkbM family methyltransferase
MVSYAQNHEDVLLQRVFAEVESGFYVDVGANHPVTFSVTHHFSSRGWRGINVEPGAIFSVLAEARPRDVNLNVAVSDACGTLPFYECPEADGISRVAGPPTAAAALQAGHVCREVQTRTLRDIFEEHTPPIIDFLSIDVEGHERQVLLGNDWTRWRPRVVLLEATLPGTPTPCHHHWEDVILGAGYLFAHFDGVNRYYVRHEDRLLLERFAAPVSVFDNFIDHYVANLHGALAQQQRFIAAQEHFIAGLQGEVDRYADMVSGIGARTLRISLGLGRRFTRLASACKKTIARAHP